MNRSAAVLLLTLVLGACVAASADGGKMKKYDDSYDREKPEKECHRPHPWSYKTYGCPTCKSNAGCIETTCSKDYEGKANVKIDLKCLFGKRIGFVAVSYYKKGHEHVCVNNQHGHSYGRYIKLEHLDCEHLPKLRFIVQNKHWWNSKGKDLDKYDICYDKCTKGKPCHTCIFKDIEIPYCKKHCKKDKCDKRHKKECPHDDHCFHYEPKHGYVKVTLKEKCYKKYDHVAVSYYDYHEGHKAVDYKYTHGEHKDYSFKAKCHTPLKWFFEDKDHYNPYYPKYPSYHDKCYNYFQYGKVCNQCGPYKDHVPDCYHDDHEYKKNEKKDEKKDEPKDPMKDEEKKD